MSRAAYAREWARNRTPEQIATKQASSKAWREKNMPKLLEDQKAWREKNKDKVKETTRKAARRFIYAQYGLEPGEYEKILEVQNGCCAICGKEPTKRPLSVDHCHDTGIVRGLLCMQCNSGIGFLKDDVNLLKQAIKYLQKKGKSWQRKK